MKVERLAREVGKNKSSFYHYFADLEVFTNHLLRYHLEQAKILARKEAECQSLEELIEIIIAHKDDLLFNRQLQVHQSIRHFAECSEQTNKLTIPGFIKIWSQILGLTDQTELAASFLKLSMGNFFLQITDENLNPTWLNQYFQQLLEMVTAFKKTGAIPFAIDGTV